jgi:hypothetical protein
VAKEPLDKLTPEQLGIWDILNKRIFYQKKVEPDEQNATESEETLLLDNSYAKASTLRKQMRSWAPSLISLNYIMNQFSIEPAKHTFSLFLHKMQIEPMTVSFKYKEIWFND